jgi:hypothetical protein
LGQAVSEQTGQSSGFGISFRLGALFGITLTISGSHPPPSG